MIKVKTPVFYTTCLIFLVILTIKELTTIKEISLFAKWNACIQDNIDFRNGSDEDILNYFSIATNKCKDVLELNIIELNSSEFHVFPLTNITETVHVTIGISRDIGGELFIKKKSQNAHVFGTFPGIEAEAVNATMFEQLGKLFPVTIGATSDMVSICVDSQTNVKDQSGELCFKSVLQLEIIYFLKTVLKHNFFTSIWFNTIFEELPAMLLLNGNFDRNQIIFCLINIKIDKHQKTTAKQLFINLINDKRYFVILDSFDAVFRFFLINFDDNRCRKELGLPQKL